ncbi:MAG: YceI family protein [Bacteroidales bacterium]|nr:YceI family protein [Bacteroidales bacterium]
MPDFRRLFIPAILILLSSLPTYSQNLEELELKEGSKIWLEGKTNISSYVCSIDSFQLKTRGILRHTFAHKDSLIIQPEHLSLTLYVSSIQCGNKMMNRDIHEALNYPDTRKIVYTYRGLKTSPEIENFYKWNPLNIKGDLEIKKVTNTAVFQVQVKHLKEHRFRVKGKHTIDMIQYGIKPPSRLNGVIKARNKLTVHFDIMIGSKSIADNL